MFKRQFVFLPHHANLLTKDLYEEVCFNEQQAILTLKENVKIGYADSFQHAIDYIYKISKLFVADTINEINLFNGIVLLRGSGKNTHETIMDLTYEYFNYSLPDVNKVTIEMKGLLNPSLKLKGHFIGLFKNFISEDTIELFSTVKGDLLDDDTVLRENMMTSLLVDRSDEVIVYQLRYIGIKQSTGELYKQVIKAANSIEELRDFQDSRYNALIDKATSIL